MYIREKMKDRFQGLVRLLKTVVREKKRIIKRCYKLWIKGKSSKDRFIEEKKKLRKYLEKKQGEKRETRGVTEQKEYLLNIKQEKRQEYDTGKQYRRKVKGPFQRITGRFRGRRDRMQERKNKKAARINGIPMKVWKNAGKDLLGRTW